MMRLIGLAIAGLVMMLTSAPGRADALTANELRQLFPGTFMAVVRGYTVQVTAKGNGVLIGTAKAIRTRAAGA